MTSINFWKQALERAVKSAAQAVVGAVLLDKPANVIHLDWKLGLGVAGGAAVLSILTSIISLPVGEPDSPSAVAEDTVS
jgi:hypothetical protein